KKLVARDPQVFPVAVADSALRPSLVAPIELARMRRRASGHDRPQVLAVGWMSGVRRGAGGSQERRHPVHRDHGLIGDRSSRDTTGPAHYRRDAKAAFEQ